MLRIMQCNLELMRFENILDLIFTIVSEFCSAVSCHSPFPTSDHNTIAYTLALPTTYITSSNLPLVAYDFDRVNYNAI